MGIAKINNLSHIKGGTEQNTTPDPNGGNIFETVLACDPEDTIVVETTFANQKGIVLFD